MLLVEPSWGSSKSQCPGCTSYKLSQSGGSLKPGITIVFRRFFPGPFHCTVKTESHCIWTGTGRHTLPWGDTHGRLPIPTQGAGVGLEMELQLAPASAWLRGGISFQISITFLWTPTMEVTTLLSQSGIWLRVRKSPCFPAKRGRQINLRCWLELLIRAGNQGAWDCLSQVRAQLECRRR